MNRRQGGRVPQKANNFWGTIKRIIAYLNKDAYVMIISAVLASIAALLSVYTPFIAGKSLTSLTDIWSGGDGVVIVMNRIDFWFFGNNLFFIPEVTMGFYTLLLVTLISAALTSLLNYTQGYLLIGITQKLTYKMRADLAVKINKLPLNFYDKYKFGDVLSRVTNDVDTINQTLTQSLSDMFRSFTLIFAILVIMFVMNWQLALITTLCTLISLWVAGRFVKISQKYFVQAAQNTGDMNGHVEEVYHGHQVVKVFNHQKKAKAEFTEINERIYQTSWKSQFISSIMIPVQFFFSNLSYIGIAGIGGYLLMKGELEIGFIMSYIMYARLVAAPVQSIGQSATVLQQTAASAERIFFLLDAKEEADESNKPKMLENVKGHVTFKDVHFSYVPETPVIQGFSADIKPGQMVAIVGPTGAGKTTIVNLLMRFYEINSGEILIDGVNIKDMKREELRNYFGMVLQDTWIFEGTVLENIKYGSENASFEDVERAAKAAQTLHFIHSLPDGFNFMLSEDGLNISAGQRQLITISRAMLRDNPMLILDEATSSVDTRTEILIQKAMDELMKGRTAFVIAHRLSTIKNADVIFVMRNGNIVEQGNHEELVAKNGYYAELYNSQFDE